jgi:hypothetical protein
MQFFQELEWYIWRVTIKFIVLVALKMLAFCIAIRMMLLVLLRLTLFCLPAGRLPRRISGPKTSSSPPLARRPGRRAWETSGLSQCHSGTLATPTQRR